MDQVPTAVQRFLDGLQSGDWTGIEDHLTPDVIQDGSMPGWRLQYQSPQRVARALHEEWTGHGTWYITEQHTTVTDMAVVVEFEAVSAPGEGPRLMVRMANVFALRNGRIAEHRYYCCGDWDEQTVRRIEAEAPKVEQSEPAHRS